MESSVSYTSLPVLKPPENTITCRQRRVPHIYPMTACPLLRASICPLRRHSLFISIPSIPSLSGPPSSLPYHWHHSIARAQTPHWLASRDPRVGSPKIASGTRARAGIPQCTIDKSTAPSTAPSRAPQRARVQRSSACLLPSPPPRGASSPVSQHEARAPAAMHCRWPALVPGAPPQYSPRAGRPTLRRGKSVEGFVSRIASRTLPFPSLLSPPPTRRVAGSVPHPRRG